MDHCISVSEGWRGGGVHTLELVPGVDDSHVCRYGVKSTASYDVHTIVSCLAVVV